VSSRQMMFMPQLMPTLYDDWYGSPLQFGRSQVNKEMIQEKELEGWGIEGRNRPLFPLRPFTHRVFTNLANSFRRSTSAASSSSSSSSSSRIISSGGYVTTRYVVVSSAGTLAVERPCISEQLFAVGASNSTCARRRRDLLYRREMEADADILASQVLPVTATALPTFGVGVSEWDTQPMILSSRSIGGDEGDDLFPLSLVDYRLYEEVVSTVTQYVFSTTTINKPLNIATDPGVLLCMPRGYVLC